MIIESYLCHPLGCGLVYNFSSALFRVICFTSNYVACLVPVLSPLPMRYNQLIKSINSPPTQFSKVTGLNQGKRLENLGQKLHSKCSINSVSCPPPQLHAESTQFLHSGSLSIRVTWLVSIMWRSAPFPYLTHTGNLARQYYVAERAISLPHSLHAEQTNPLIAHWQQRNEQ